MADLNLTDIVKDYDKTRVIFGVDLSINYGWRHDDHQQASLPKSSKRQVYRVQAMLRFLAENFRQPTTVADVADRAGISKGHASALFQSQMNISIIGYLTELRLYHAQSALAIATRKSSISRWMLALARCRNSTKYSTAPPA